MPPSEPLGTNEEQRARDSAKSILSDIYSNTSNKLSEDVQNSATSFLSDIYKRASNGLSEDTPQHALAKIPKLGPSMSTSSYFPFSAHRTRRIEESEPKSDISQHEIKKRHQVMINI